MGGGINNNGTLFELTPTGNGWTERVLHSFTGGNDGLEPTAGLVADPAGNLYGTTEGGGGGAGCSLGCGTVYKLASLGDDNWTESVLYAFNSGTDGSYPVAGIIMDSTGHLYGTTSRGGAYDFGTVFEITP